MVRGACVGDVDGLTEGAFGVFKLADDAHRTTDEGTIALHRCMVHACVGNVDGPTEGVFGAVKLADDAHGTTD